MLRAALFALALTSAYSAPAFANGLQAEQVVERATVSVDANGQETRTYALATEVAPGDEVRYSLAYENTGDTPAEAVNLVMPIPAEVTYIEASASTDQGEVTYSADGGESYAARAALMVGAGDAARPAAADEITHIKWAFAEPIAAMASGQVSFSAVLN